MSGSWVEIRFYCPNCGSLCVGFRRKDGSVLVRCKRCECTVLSRRIEPKVMEMTVSIK